jgi:deoxyribodipyrimidine photo-lyase
MIANRRLHWNFSLQRAVEWAVELRKPLVIFEPLRSDYPWACARFHRFVIDGMAENAQHIQQQKNPAITYYPYVEPTKNADHGLWEAFARQACVVVTDDFPAFFLPRMVATVARKAPVAMESVDSNGLFPMHATDRVFTTAFSFRKFLQATLAEHLPHPPQADPLAGAALPKVAAEISSIQQRWPAASLALLKGEATAWAKLTINHAIPPVPQVGGSREAYRRLVHFLDHQLSGYAERANEPDEDLRSGLSPYLHFGHLSPHAMFHELMQREAWHPEMLAKHSSGKREGWWGVSASAESWLDEFITWRELGYNLCSHTSDFTHYESLPAWAQATLKKHERDPREHCYTLTEFAEAATHDSLWNAAQTQLVREGRIHNYLRMLWGKKILEWSATPREALATMIELNNRYALDGRNPNSYTGIFWVLGHYDRPWGPERPIFGTVRYMSSDNTRKKLHVKKYLAEYQSKQRRLL